MRGVGLQSESKQPDELSGNQVAALGLGEP